MRKNRRSGYVKVHGNNNKKGLAVFRALIIVFGCLPQSIFVGGALAEERGGGNGKDPGNTGFEP